METVAGQEETIAAQSLTDEINVSYIEPLRVTGNTKTAIAEFAYCDLM